jgi:3-dehydroquinate dehydratase-1
MKVILPISGKDEVAILQQAAHVKSFKPDIVEWRADYFDWGGELSNITAMAAKLRQALEGIPLLFTCRIAHCASVQKITENVVTSGSVDMIDIEFIDGRAMSVPTRDRLEIIISHHDFEKTPSKDELVAQMLAMQAAGADIVKIAVMPQSPEDVTTLLSATRHFSQLPDACPVIGISMGEMGAISRIEGGLYGSYATFAHAGEPTAPGQIHVTELRKTIKT